MQELPLGKTNFVSLREDNYIYVDKTKMIFDLARTDAKILLSRPRRFGKSLLVDTFKTLFTSGTKYFKGLAIESLWDDKTYPVIHLDFSRISAFESVEVFKTRFFDLVLDACRKTDKGWSTSLTFDAAKLFRQFLDEHESSSLVLLIDEYDAPLNHVLDKPTIFEAIRLQLSSFYSEVKANDTWRFLFITGIVKFSKTSVFSELNNLTDISLEPKFGTLLGYTEEELEKNFAEHLTEAERELNLTHEELMAKLRENYDGFCFERTTTKHVYAPWSTLNFLRSPESGFENYWYSSGGRPTVLVKYFGGNRIDLLRETAKTRSIKKTLIADSTELERMKAETLLYQTGYLTLKGTDEGVFELGFPNAEVRTSMMSFYSDLILNGSDLIELEANKILKHLKNCNFDAFVSNANRALLGIDYTKYPLQDEASVRAAIQMFLLGMGLTALPEVHNALGRSDLEFDLGENHWVLEFKYAETEKEADAKLKDALDQIEERRYGEYSQKKLMRYALVYTAKTKQITHFADL